MVARPAPTAEGNLSKTPFAHLLLYLRERGLSGSLTLQHMDDELAGESLLLVQRGQLLAHRVPGRRDTVDSLLRALRGAIDRPAALRLLAQRHLLPLFRLNQSPYQYFDGIDLVSGTDLELAPQDLLAVVWPGIKTMLEPPRTHPAIETVLQRAQRGTIRLKSDSQEFARAEFSAQDQAVLDVLRFGPASLQELIAAAQSPEHGQSVAYFLLATKLGEVQADAPRPAAAVSVAPPPKPQPAPVALPPAPQIAPPPVMPPVTTTPAPGGPPRRVTPPPMAAVKVDPIDTLPPSLKEKYREAEKRFTDMQEETYFQMLGLADNASEADVRSAFMEKAAEWHPDRAPVGARALKDKMQDIFSLLNEAQATLTEEKMRKRYLNQMKDGGGTPAAQRKILALLEASSESQKAEVFFRRHEYAEAERLARRARSLNPEDVSALIVLAAVLLQRIQDTAVKEPEELLLKAIELAPENERAHGLLAELYRRLGNKAKCLEHYRKVLKINPKNVDAARELRLSEMRQQRNAPDNSVSGLLNKFFKK